MTPPRKKGGFLLALGALFLLAALGLTGFNLWDNARAGQTAEETALLLQEVLPEPTPEGEPTLPAYWDEAYPDREMPTLSLGDVRYIGLLEIPSLDLVLPIQAEWDYARLRESPCVYAGSVYQKNLVLAGHNYQSHFSPIKTLPLGSELRFTDAEGTVFTYTVVGAEILDPTDVEGMTLATPENPWDLTLFTCTTGGSRRFALRCQLIPAF